YVSKCPMSSAQVKLRHYIVGRVLGCFPKLSQSSFTEVPGFCIGIEKAIHKCESEVEHGSITFGSPILGIGGSEGLHWWKGLLKIVAGLDRFVFAVVQVAQSPVGDGQLDLRK